MKYVLLLAIVIFSLEALPQPTVPAHKARILETMDAGGYTYMKVQENGKIYWAAVTAMPVKVGQTVVLREQMWMTDFPSRTLGRTFDRILFATAESRASSRMPPGEPVRPKAAPNTVLPKLKDGYSVEEVFARRAALEGKRVKVRGIVTKISKQIMKRTWVHLEDGTGDEQTNDLVFTTVKAVDIEVGDTVIAEGTAVADKDFGYGYYYPVILENSRFTRER